MDNLIYKFINQSVRNVDTYQHNGSTWLIFTNDKKWVIELTKDKTLWYNYTFFKSIFDFFSIDVVENQHYITKWVEDSIINGIKETQFNWHENKSWVNGVIQNGVNETLNTEYMPKVMVEDTIQNGVKHTQPLQRHFHRQVEDTIQNGVKHTNVFYDTFEGRVKDIIQNGVKGTNGTLRRTLLGVDDIIQNGVKETKTPGNGDLISTVEWLNENNSNSYPKMIDEVIENGIKQIEPLPAQDGNRDWGNYYHGKEDRTKPFNEYLDEAIRFGVKETHDDVYHHKGRIEGVIKCGKIII